MGLYKILGVWILALCCAPAFAGTVAGVQQNASGGALANGTFSFQLTQAATLSGTANVSTAAVNCYTDQNGNVVGEPNPLVLPLLSSNLATGTLAGGTYFVKLTYFDAPGESFPGPEASVTLASAGTLIVAAPVKQPANASGYRVYIGTAAGAETLQGSVAGAPGSWGNFSQASALAAGTALPVSNTTTCKVRFNDELTPNTACYDVGLTSVTGATVPGYPQYWYLSGGSAGTVNISLGTPQSNVCQGSGWLFPQAIMTTPPFNATQSINGGLNLNGFGLTAGSVTVTGPATVGTLGGATAINNVQQASSTVSIATAYAALPSTGGMVALTSDITLSTATALTTTLGKPLFLSLGGHMITCTNASGVCLKILKPDGTPRDPMVIMNGVIAYGGVSTGVTGIQIGDATHAATNIFMSNVAISNFNTANSVGMDLSFVEDGHFDSITLNGNTLALQLDINTNQNQFSNFWFQQNVTALQATDANEYTFNNCLFQSNSGTKPVQVIASTVNVVNVQFLHCHFENNGDTTSSTRQISFNAATGKKILRVEVVGDLFNGGVNNPSTSYAMEFIGAGTVGPLHIEHNQYSNSAHTFDPASTSLIAAGGLTVINDNFQATDAGLNLSNITGCDNLGEGLVFGPFGALKIFQIRGGGPSDFQSTLLFKDCTVPEYILSYSSSTWNFQNKLIKTSSQFQTTATTGTAPFIVASTTPVANLTVSNHPTEQNCGTTTTCSATADTGVKIVRGSAPLVSGTPSAATVTGFSPAFTSSSTFVCTVSNATTQANPVKVSNASASSITITGPNTVTDTVNYICVGT